MENREISQLHQWLLNYPLIKPPIPKGYPRDLAAGTYPGQDYVVGLCTEMIDILVKGAAQYPQNRPLLGVAINYYQAMRSHRLRKLRNRGNKLAPHCYNPRRKYESVGYADLRKRRIRAEKWLETHPEDPKYARKLLDYQRLSDRITEIEVKISLC